MVGHGAIRSAYQFEVPGLPSGFVEEELERALFAYFERLITEFGPDFYIRRRQQPLTIDGQLHRINLELYCRAIPCIVLVDLKVGPFEDRDAGQMNKYVNYYRERVPQYPWEKIFVAEYRVKLPSEERIKERLETIDGEPDA